MIEETKEFEKNTLEQPTNDNNVDIQNNSNPEISKTEIFEEDKKEPLLDISQSNKDSINKDDINTTNCLALTIQKDHKLVAVKNVFFGTIRMSLKVIFSSISLTILKFFT